MYWHSPSFARSKCTSCRFVQAVEHFNASRGLLAPNSCATVAVPSSQEPSRQTCHDSTRE
eukprot:3377324-Amphidinium_carterae.1